MQVIGFSTLSVPDIERVLSLNTYRGTKLSVGLMDCSNWELPSTDCCIIYTVEKYRRMYQQLTKYKLVVVVDSALVIGASGIHSFDTISPQVFRYLAVRKTPKEFAVLIQEILDSKRKYLAVNPDDWETVPKLIGQYQGHLSGWLLNLIMSTTQVDKKREISWAFYDFICGGSPDVFTEKMLGQSVKPEMIDRVLEWAGTAGKTYRDAVVWATQQKATNYKVLAKKFEVDHEDIRYFLGHMKKLLEDRPVHRTTKEIYEGRQVKTLEVQPTETVDEDGLSWAGLDEVTY